MNTTQEDGGPAFPGKRMENIALPDQKPNFAELEYAGLSIRDWFAGMALQGIAASQNDERWEYQGGDLDFHKWAPQTAYEIADAMLAARKEKP